MRRLRQRVGWWLGPVLLVTMLLIPLPGLTPEAHRLAAVMALVITFWVTEAIPLAATALLGPALCVVLGVGEDKKVLAPFASPVTFLFIGTFMIAAAMRKYRARSAHGAVAAVETGAGAHPRTALCHARGADRGPVDVDEQCGHHRDDAADRPGRAQRLARRSATAARCGPPSSFSSPLPLRSAGSARRSAPHPTSSGSAPCANCWASRSAFRNGWALGVPLVLVQTAFSVAPATGRSACPDRHPIRTAPPPTRNSPPNAARSGPALPAKKIPSPSSLPPSPFG